MTWSLLGGIDGEHTRSGHVGQRFMSLDKMEEEDDPRFHRATWGVVKFRTCELLILGTFHWIFLDRDCLQVAVTAYGKGNHRWREADYCIIQGKKQLAVRSGCPCSLPCNFFFSNLGICWKCQVAGTITTSRTGNSGSGVPGTVFQQALWAASVHT